jgi:hypothetical protein
LLLVGDVLIAKQQHGVFVHAGFDIGRFLWRQRLAQIDTGNFAEKMPARLPDRDRHGVSPQAAGGFVPLRLGEKLLSDITMSTPREAWALR